MKDGEKNVIEHSYCDFLFKFNHFISFMVKARVNVYVPGFKILTSQCACKQLMQDYIMKAEQFKTT